MRRLLNRKSVFWVIFMALTFVFMIMLPHSCLAEEAETSQLTETPIVQEETAILSDINSTADVTNEITTTVNTGSNTVTENDDSGIVDTGNANTNISVINSANSVIILTDGAVLNLITNNSIGNLNDNYLLADESGNTFKLSEDGKSLEQVGCGLDPCQAVAAKVIYLDKSDATIINNIMVTSNTGHNLVTQNDGDGTVTTGDSNILINLLNLVNTNIKISGSGTIAYINVLGDWNGDLQIPENYISEISDKYSLNKFLFFIPGTNSLYLVTNSANTSNNIKVDSKTGENEIEKSHDSGNITTGESDVQLSLLNLENQNIIGDNIVLFIVNVLGDWNGESKLTSITPNVVKNYGDYETSGVGNNLVSIENNASVQNNVLVNSNTGGNKININDGEGTIKTGDSKVVVNLINFLNLNIIAHDLKLVIINVLGDWNGGIVPEPQIIIVDGGDNPSQDAGVITAYASNPNTFKRTRPSVFFASASGVQLVESTQDDEDKTDGEVLGDIIPKSGSENKCNWGWILALLLLALLFGNYILADVFLSNKFMKYLLLSTPVVMGLIVIIAHNLLSKSLTHTLFCDYLWLIAFVEIIIYYMLRYRGLKLIKKQ